MFGLCLCLLACVVRVCNYLLQLLFGGFCINQIQSAIQGADCCVNLQVLTVLGLASSAIISYGLALVVRVSPWYDPQVRCRPQSVA